MNVCKIHLLLMINKMVICQLYKNLKFSLQEFSLMLAGNLSMVLRIIVFGVFTTGVSFGQDLITPGPWPGRLWNDITSGGDRSGTQLTNVLFDQLDDFDFGKSYAGITGKIGINRGVYDNQDVMNTWTVNDQFFIDLSRSATEFSIPLVPSATLPLNFNIGVGGVLKINHIRQTLASRYKDLPTIDELHGEVKRQADRWNALDPSLRPRFSKIWAPLLNVYRIPWTKQDLRKLGKDEIISYSTSGYVCVGLETGFVPIQLPAGVDLTFGVGVQAFLKGEFRITVLKEDDRFVRVKLTRVRSTGTGATVGAETSRIQMFEGFLLFEGTNIETRLLETNITVVPFKFNWETELKNQSDVGYRFDLEDPGAEEAFEKAMRGSFTLAGKLAGKGHSVTHLITRNSNQKTVARSLRLGMNWLAEFGMGAQKKDQWITLERPDGTYEIFKTSLELSRSWSTFWGTGEKKNFLFSVILDETRFERNEDNSFQLMTEVLYEDVNTSATEIRDYIRDAEAVIGNENILPELPLLVPDGNDKFKMARYNRSSFYFGQYLSQKQVMKFLMTSKEKAWEIAHKSFDYLSKGKRNRRAEKFYNHWMSLQDRFTRSMSKSEMSQALMDLRSLFKFHRKAIHALKTIVLALDKEEIDFFLTATNLAFGRVQFSGRNITNAEKLLRLADDAIEFEGQAGSIRTNPDALIKDLKVTQEDDKHIKVVFSLPEKSNYLFFKILRTSGWKRIKTLKEFIFVNRDRFNSGQNTWIISLDSSDKLEEEIVEAFKDTNYYTFQMSSSPDRSSWGRVASNRFRFKVKKAENLEEGSMKKK